MTRVNFLDPAKDEMFQAEEYYEQQAPGLGREFIAEVNHTVKGIADHPKSGRTVKREVRRRLVRRFPFGILYRIDPNEIVILAVMHLRRHPGYWLKRI